MPYVCVFFLSVVQGIALVYFCSFFRSDKDVIQLFGEKSIPIHELDLQDKSLVLELFGGFQASTSFVFVVTLHCSTQWPLCLASLPLIRQSAYHSSASLPK